MLTVYYLILVPTLSDHINHTYCVNLCRLWSECSFEFVRSALFLAVYSSVGVLFVWAVSLFYHRVLLSLHLFIHVYVCLVVREKEMGIMADWLDALQEVLCNISELRGRVKGYGCVGGGDWLEIFIQLTDSFTVALWPPYSTIASQFWLLLSLHM